jgi:hypothetical protein
MVGQFSDTLCTSCWGFHFPFVVEASKLSYACLALICVYLFLSEKRRRTIRISTDRNLRLQFSSFILPFLFNLVRVLLMLQTHGFIGV